MNKNIFCNSVNCILCLANKKHNILLFSSGIIGLTKSYDGYICGNGNQCIYITETGRVREWWSTDPFKIISALIKFNKEANE